MYNSVIIENLMNPKIQEFRKEAALTELLNQAYPDRKGLFERINQRIHEINVTKIYQKWVLNTNLLKGEKR